MDHCLPTRQEVLESGPAFLHQPLSEPTKQIRLLRLQPGKAGEPLSMKMTTCYLDEAPYFRAISYVWGDEIYRSVCVNGHLRQVRQNCYYALWQARLHYPDEYMWIDSLCIDQEDLGEKASQIRLMEDIYQKSYKVLASVGPHEDDSEVLAEVVQKIRDILEEKKNETFMPSDSYWTPWLEGLREPATTRICRALRAFPERAYWTRLWVVQEIAASVGRLEVLCGTVIFNWSNVKLFFELANEDGYYSPPNLRDAKNMSITARQAYSLTRLNALHRLDLDEAIKSFLFCRCSDDRDRLYGVLGLVAWPGKSIVPDYNKTTFQVALDAIPHLKDVSRLAELLAALRIHYTHEEMRSLFVSGATTQNKESSVREERSTTSDPSDAFPDLSTYVLGHYAHIPCCKILSGKDDRPTIAVRRSIPEGPLTNSGRELFSQACSNFRKGCPSEDHRTVPFFLQHSGEDVALVCSAAKARDIIAPLSPSRLDDQVFLVLRETDNDPNRFDIIGQGFYLPGFTSASVFSSDEDALATEEKESLVDAQIQLTATAADIMRLYGQDFIDMFTHDWDARFQRLATNAVENPRAAVELEVFATGVSKAVDVQWDVVDFG